MTALGDRLAQRIRMHGPLTVAEFMAEALGNPQHGYYMTRDPLGRGGDFITAPEISQVFGELIGLWAADLWDRIGRPEPLVLAELGPGRGTLMADALRAARLMPGFLAALQLHLVETSPTLRRAQGSALAAYDPHWHDSIATLPEGPLLLVANEFLDALPIRQLVRTGLGWAERLVGLNTAGAFAFTLAAPHPAADVLVPPALRAAPVGGLFEFAPAALGIVDALSRRIARQGGAALFLDYGHTVRACGETLQAVRDHNPCPVLQDPGEVDLTTHVDFAAIAEAAVAADAAVWGPVTQGDFLRALGIESRLERLAADAAPEQAAEIVSAGRRLIDPGGMGTLFKVLAIAARDRPAPAGFPAAAEARGNAP
ncbi:MAG: synthase subunit beta [Rhodospirillales bacterium]|nr:synthase subunit beta [Rhodospirillales bacterium]